MMGMITKSISFFSDEIEMTEIVSATKAETFELEGKPIRRFIKESMARLEEEVGEPGHYFLELVPSGEFVEFYERR